MKLAKLIKLGRGSKYADPLSPVGVMVFGSPYASVDRQPSPPGGGFS